MKKWENFSDEQLISFVSESYSFRQLAEKCGYEKSGGSGIAAVKQMCQEKNFDISHFSNKLRKEDVNIEEVFIQGYKSRETLKNNLIALRGHKCEYCNLSEWNNQDIPLQVHHIDGDGLNNTLSNLQLLCPNCHAQTDNYCGRNKKKKISDEEFIEALKNSENIHQAIIKIGSTDGQLYEKAKKLIKENNISFKEKEQEKYYCKKCHKELGRNYKTGYCFTCYQESQRKVERPTRDELKQLIRTKPFTQIGEMYGVSDNAIRKWCVAEKLPNKKTEINSYNDEQWKLI